MAVLHAPVLVSETLALLEPSRGGLFVDCTVGLGGHSRALLEAGASRVLGLDRDADALELAAAELAPFGDRVELVHADYRDLEQVLDGRGIAHIAGALADLGVSSMQLGADGRGFSFQRDEPLDMRMDRSRPPTAADLLADVDEEELANVIFQYGEERYSRRIARAIVQAREVSPVATTGQLARIVRRAIPVRGHQRIDPGDAHLPGVAHPGQSRARRTRRVSRRRGPAAHRGRPAGGDCVPFARRPHRQTHVPRPRARRDGHPDSDQAADRSR